MLKAVFKLFNERDIFFFKSDVYITYYIWQK